MAYRITINDPIMYEIVRLEIEEINRQNESWKPILLVLKTVSLICLFCELYNAKTIPFKIMYYIWAVLIYYI